MAAPLFVEDKVIGLVYHLQVRLGALRRRTSASSPRSRTRPQRSEPEAQEGVAARHSSGRCRSPGTSSASCPTDPGCRTHLMGMTVPSRTTSGDYYDFFERADKTVDIVVADVCGRNGRVHPRGVGAGGVQVWAGENFPPDRLCTRLNDLVFRRTSPRSSSRSSSRSTIGTARSSTNAGHNPAILVRADGTTELLRAHGPPLGLFPSKVYASGTLTMKTGDLLVLYRTASPKPRGERRRSSAPAPRRVAKASAKASEGVGADIGNTLAAFVAGTPYRRPDAGAPRGPEDFSRSTARRGRLPLAVAVHGCRGRHAVALRHLVQRRGLQPRSSAALLDSLRAGRRWRNALVGRDRVSGS